MAYVWVAQLVIAVALLVAARYFIKGPENPGNLEQDDTPTTLASRGAYIPIVIGRRRVGCVFGAAGNRTTRQESVGSASGGKGDLFGGGGGGQQTQTVYLEDGWHQLCVGPANKLFGIYQNGKAIWQGVLSAATTPSGTEVSAGDEGTFIIYWGFSDQPVDAGLAALTGIESRWPMVCYIYWVQKRLGGSPTWPTLEYDLEALCPGTTLGTAPNILDNGETRGVNPHAVLYQLHTAEWPHGVGLDPQYVDSISLSAVGVTCEDEHLAANILIDSGKEFKNVVEGILLDIGCMEVDKAGILVFNMIRPDADIPNLGYDVLLAEDVEVEAIQGDASADRVIFTFARRELNYRTQDIKYDDDAIAEEHNRYRAKTIALTIPTQMPVAKTIANRRVQEAFGNAASSKYRGSRGAVLMLPGQGFTASGGVGPMRVMSVQADAYSPRVLISAILDSYAVPTILDGYDDDILIVPPPVAEDLAFTWLELPASISGADTISVAVFRIRAHQAIAGSRIYGSVEGASYSLLGAQPVASAGGPLTTTIASGGPDIIATGPIFEALNFDVLDVLDLSALPTEWRNGKQLAVIGEEAFFLQNVDPQSEPTWAVTTAYSIGDAITPASGVTGFRYVCTTAGTSGATEPTWPTARLLTVLDGTAVWEARHFRYEMQGLIRARLESVNASHAVDDVVYIIKQGDCNRIPTPAQPGTQLCIKSMTFTSEQILDISGQTPDCDQITGIAFNKTFLEDDAGNFIVTALGENIYIVE